MPEMGDFAAIVQGTQGIGAGRGEGGEAIGRGKRRREEGEVEQWRFHGADIERGEARDRFARVGVGPCDEHRKHCAGYAGNSLRKSEPALWRRILPSSRPSSAAPAVGPETVSRKLRRPSGE